MASMKLFMEDAKENIGKINEMEIRFKDANE